MSLTEPTLEGVNPRRWPIDTAAGKVVLFFGLVLMAIAATGIRVYNAWWGYPAVVMALALTFGFRSLFFRGYFGNRDYSGDE